MPRGEAVPVDERIVALVDAVIDAAQYADEHRKDGTGYHAVAKATITDRFVAEWKQEQHRGWLVRGRSKGSGEEQESMLTLDLVPMAPDPDAAEAIPPPPEEGEAGALPPPPHTAIIIMPRLRRWLRAHRHRPLAKRLGEDWGSDWWLAYGFYRRHHPDLPQQPATADDWESVAQALEG